MLVFWFVWFPHRSCAPSFKTIGFPTYVYHVSRAGSPVGNVRVGERDKPGTRGTGRGQEMGSTGTFGSTCSAGRTRTASIKHHAYSNYYRRGVTVHQGNGIAKGGAWSFAKSAANRREASGFCLTIEKL